MRMTEVEEGTQGEQTLAFCTSQICSISVFGPQRQERRCQKLSYQILYFWEKETLCLIQNTHTHTAHSDVSSVTSQSADYGMGLTGLDKDAKDKIGSKKHKKLCTDSQTPLMSFIKTRLSS